ncbi:MAG: hypothetical protein PQJ61_05570 [Spirochaetales bacterium]|uniref:Uncharacterized protein n=1 Tax=Candidatus Thalassospirochaeta sargassi TaxID=3119039 RepID=A0AAJ1IBG8_9SPIO|nr:hypothetical protein [Spirochaetales bacterium]
MNRKTLTILLLLTIFFTAAAAAQTEAAVFSEWAASARLIVFDAGYPELVESDRFSGSGLIDNSLAAAIEASSEMDFKPQTRALRTAGFAQLPDGILIIVNCGYPILLDTQHDNQTVIVQPDANTAEDYLKKSAGMTVGTVYVEGGTAGIHLYKDRLFVSDDDMQESGRSDNDVRPVVIECTVGPSGMFSIDIPEYRFAAENPGWEAVELIHRENYSLVAWKYSDDKKSRFRYIIHDENGNAIDETDEKRFRDEYNLKPAELGPFALRGFVQAAREGAVKGLQDYGDLYLRQSLASESSAGTDVDVYYSKAGSAAADRNRAPAQLQVCSDGELWYVLSGESVFVCGRNISRNELPSLPDNFRYTDIWASGRTMLICYEERRFPFNGRSGMILIKMRDILN